jgi:hypothetical protein
MGPCGYRCEQLSAGVQAVRGAGGAGDRLVGEAMRIRPLAGPPGAPRHLAQGISRGGAEMQRDCREPDASRAKSRGFTGDSPGVHGVHGHASISAAPRASLRWGARSPDHPWFRCQSSRPGSRQVHGYTSIYRDPCFMCGPRSGRLASKLTSGQTHQQLPVW